MAISQLTDTELMCSVTESLIADGNPHRAGELYEKFVEQTGGVGASGKSISRKVYESFLRLQVLRENGSLKRTAFGVYQKRSNPEDRGIITYNRAQLSPFSFDECDEALFQSLVAGNCSDDLYNLLDQTYELTGKLKTALDAMCALPGSKEEQTEIHSIRESTLKQVDIAITGITCAIAWKESYDENHIAHQHEDDQEVDSYEMNNLGMQM